MKSHPAKIGTPLLSLLVLIAASGCSLIRTTGSPAYAGKYVPFTERMIRTYSLSPADLGQMKFYVSRDIIVRRELPAGEALNIKGQVMAMDGKSIDEIAISQYAAGVPSHVYLDLDLLSVKFDNAAAPLDFIASDSTGYRFRFALGDNHSPIFDDPAFHTEKGGGSAILLIDADTFNSLKSRKHA